MFHQQIDNPTDAHLFRVGQARKPIDEIIKWRSGRRFRAPTVV